MTLEELDARYRALLLQVSRLRGQVFVALKGPPRERREALRYVIAECDRILAANAPPPESRA